MWVRGLKLLVQGVKLTSRHVAPYVGAWIETTSALIASRLSDVAPYVGAWIETDRLVLSRYLSWSHPMWVRGLKLL